MNQTLVRYGILEKLQEELREPFATGRSAVLLGDKRLSVMG